MVTWTWWSQELTGCNSSSVSSASPRSRIANLGSVIRRPLHAHVSLVQKEKIAAFVVIATDTDLEPVLENLT